MPTRPRRVVVRLWLSQHATVQLLVRRRLPARLRFSRRAATRLLGLRRATACSCLSQRAAARLHARRCASAESAQASLEYLLVAVAFIAMVAALGALWDFADGGGFADIAASLQSHTADSAGGVADALLY